MSSIPKRFAPAAFLVLILVLTSTSPAEPIPAKGGWYEITDEELAATEPKVDPDAAVELLLREVNVNDSDPETTRFKHYYRAKIFTESGIDEFSKIDLEYLTGWFVTDIKARVIYPDGSIADLDRKDVYKREIYKDGEFESNAKSFSFPGLSVGCIVEYRWTQVRKFWSWGLQIDMLAKWPTWHFKTAIRPYRGAASSIRFYNAAAKWEKKGDEFRIELKSRKASSDKPFLAARKDFEPFIALVYAGSVEQFDPEKYWGYRGGDIVSINKSQIKAKAGRVKKVADEIFEGLDSTEDKLKAAYKYCTEEVINISSYTDVYTEEEIENLDSNASPVDTLMHGYGNRFHINTLFAALCANQDIDAYMSQVENHNQFSYKQYAIGSFNLPDWVVAVRSEDGWRFFDPGSGFLPFGVLNPENSGGDAIVADRKYYYVSETPAVEPSFSRLSRLAEAKIDEFGDLTASIKILYKGYSALARKRLLAPLSQEERKVFIEEEWQSRLSRTEIDHLFVENDETREKPLLVSYDIKVPGFADILGDRIILNPSIFEVGKANLFPDQERSEPAAFDYLPEVLDKVVLRIPEGFVIEDSRPILAVEDNDLMARKSMIEEGSQAGEYVYQRYYSFKHRLIYGHNYPVLKAAFDYTLSMDSVMLSFTKD